jgi:hypothetical protein
MPGCIKISGNTRKIQPVSQFMSGAADKIFVGG